MLKKFDLIGVAGAAFCAGMLYGMVFVHTGSLVLSVVDYKCTKTELVGKSPRRSESCVKYERKGVQR